MKYLINLICWNKEPETIGEGKFAYSFHRMETGVSTTRELKNLEEAKKVGREMWSDDRFKDSMKRIVIFVGDNRKKNEVPDDTYFE